MSTEERLPASNRDHRQPDSPAEARRKRDRSEAVEHGFGQQRVGVVKQAVLEGADDGHRADTEQQARREEAFGDRWVMTVGTVGLMPRGELALQCLAERHQPVLDPH